MKRNFTIVIILIALSKGMTWCEGSPGGREIVQLENSVAKVIVDLAGGSIADFHLKENPLNPLNWNRPGESDSRPRSMGHFICFDRWGPASEAETKNGMPWHGEATGVHWNIIEKPTTKDGRMSAQIQCELPMAGLKLKRTLRLNKNHAVLAVTDEITNVNKLGRIFNLVQHATLGPPFLVESTMIDTKAGKGFVQKSGTLLPEEPVIHWPKAVHEGQLIDFRTLSGENAGPSVISFVFDEKDKFGWVTAGNPNRRLLIGYFWKTDDYPWLNTWRNLRDDRPAAYGLEFGTTGLHQPFGVLVEKREIFDRQLYEYIDANQTIVKSYTAFLAKIPADYKGVAAIQFRENKIVLKEHGCDGSRDIMLNVK